MKNYTQISEGFVHPNEESNINQKQHKQFNFYQKFIKEDSPLDILSSEKHSLGPDMLFGWRPKLPSCPCPLKFPNQTVDNLIPLIAKDDRYKIAYIGSRPVNSIQINQKYTYSWKYRQRYSLNMALVDQSYKTNAPNQIINNEQQQGRCQYEFDSSFQSGNLDLAVRIKPNQYDCYIRSDSNTKGHCNWFYFKISNKNRIGQVQINICNIGKVKNLYNKGMKPFALELNQKCTQQKSWSQDLCYDVSFVERLSRFQNDKKSFQLQFKYNFKQQNTQILVAYGIPYTYSRLESFIKQISTSHQQIVKSQKLCESLGGVNLPLIKITNPAHDYQKQFQPLKKAVIVTARIHPGQSHSSFLLQGFVRELLQDKSNILRQMFVFYIIPMLNPDGVIVGNYRTSYSGKDLNRQFQNLERYIFPQIFYLNDLVMDIRKKHFKGVQFFFDFHGHSSKKNLFAYGPDHSPHSPYFLKSRIFAKLLQDITPVFSYKKSIFTISQGKKKTGRAHMIRKLKIPMVYTFQISNGMYQTKNRQDILLNQKILSNCGNSIIKGLFKYARLQMKIPSHLIRPKVDTGNGKKRIIKSSKQIRTAVIKRRKPSAILQDQINLRQGVKSAKIFNQEEVNFENNKIQLDLINLNEEQKDKLFSNQEFQNMLQNMHLYNNSNQSQGGSDSESEGQDLSKEQSNKLFNQIVFKKNEAINKQKQQKNKKVRINAGKRPKLMTQNSKDILNQIKFQMKNNKDKKLLQILNQRNKMKQASIPKNQVQKKLKAPQKAIFRQRSNFANFQTNKDIYVQKVPIVQKNFNLEIYYQNA